MDKDQSSSPVSTPSIASLQVQDLLTASELYQTHLNQHYHHHNSDGNDDKSNSKTTHLQPRVPQKPLLSVDTSRERQCASGPNTGVPFVPASLAASSPQIARASSFRALYPLQSSLESDRLGYFPSRYSPSSSSSSSHNYLPSSPSMTSLRTFSCTPTTENLARRMAQSNTPNHTNSLSMSSLDSESHFHQTPTSQRPTSSGDGLIEGQTQQGSETYRASPTEMKLTENASTHSLSTPREDGAATKADLVSYLPRIPAASTTASEEERVAKWGPEIGPPTVEGSYTNPYNYGILEAYCEQADHPMYNVAESTRRAGNAAIQTMFDPLYALPGLNGEIPRGFPLYGFSMREMPTMILKEVLCAYGIEPIEGVGYEVDRRNMSLLCGHIGATWLSGVI
ncbi:hypothetical protein TWF481_008608 [Arthrobotrys musiformis]|uniref:Uncharacterized protein n=1 Tax=Arthrobotrys musiformis TaxID=47236 RepID=A0AAV9W7N6_9PEZI